MKLTEANLRILNEPSRSPSPIPLSHAARIRNAKLEIRGTILALRRMGRQGLKHTREADVYVDEAGDVAYRGSELPDVENPSFWERHVDIIHAKFNDLAHIYGLNTTLRPAPPVVIDEAASAKEGMLYEYSLQFKAKFESWLFANRQPQQAPGLPPPTSTDTRRARQRAGRKRGLDDDDAPCFSGSTTSHKCRRISVLEPEPWQTQPSTTLEGQATLGGQAATKRRWVRYQDTARATSGRLPERRSRRLAGLRPEYGMLP